MATRKELEDALIQADTAGDTEAAELFAGMIRNNEFSSPEEISQAGSLVAGASQGATLGFGDEVAGGFTSLLAKVPGGKRLVNRLMGLDADYRPVQLSDRARMLAEQMGIEVPDDIYSYSAQRDRYRDFNERASEANPGTFLAGELGSGIAAGAPGLIRAAAGQAAKVGIPRLAAVAGAEGGVAGAGYSDEDTAGGVAEDAALGAGLGATLGAAVPGLGVAAGRGVRALSPSSRAAGQVGSDLKAAGLTPEDAQRALDANPDMVLADLGSALQQRLGAAANAPGRTADAALSLLERRNIEQLERLTPQFSARLGGGDVLEAAKRTTLEASERARPLYDIAYETPVPPAGQRAWQKLVEKPSVKSALTKARRLSRDEGVAIAEEGPVDVRTLDYVMRGLSDAEGAFLRGGKGNNARVQGGLRRQVAEIADSASPEFLEARKIHASRFADNAALETGRKALRTKLPELREAVADMGESELTNFRIGVFDDIMDKLGNKSETANMVQDFKRPNFREKVRMAFGDDEAFNAFTQVLGDEEAMFKTMRTALQGSPTYSRQSFGGIVGDAALDLATGSPAQTVSNLLRRGTQAVGNPQSVRDQAGALLLSRNPAQQLNQLTTPSAVGAPTAALASPAALDPEQTLNALLGR